MEESGRPSCGQSQAAYTDIDGTVTAYNTIFELLRFDAAEHSREAEVDELGERWADAQAASPEAWTFLEPVTSLLDAHARSGRRIVAVTASFEPALVGVRRRWPNLEMLCTLPRTDKGRYTGDIEEALVGEAKGRAVASHAAEHAVDLSASFAYGDHHSDLQFMALAGESLLVIPAVKDVPASAG